jgi:hypothetical protein
LFRYLAVIFRPLRRLGGKTFYFKIFHKLARYLCTCSVRRACALRTRHSVHMHSDLTDLRSMTSHGMPFWT